jgi:ATP-dependent Clp protease ATP-binding subunit ClpA
VVLLDEIEKAHQDVYNILLQVMDHGKLTDHNGKKVDFRNVILIMTTNAGAADWPSATRSASAAASGKATTTRRSSRMFAPEFRNRLDAIVPFAHLTPEVIAMVVQKFVLQLEAQLADRTSPSNCPTTRRLAGQERLRRALGARPMARVIQEHIKKPLADDECCSGWIIQKRQAGP